MANIDKNASYMDDNSYFAKNHSNSNEQFSENEIIKMLEILEICLFELAGLFFFNKQYYGSHVKLHIAAYHKKWKDDSPNKNVDL